jgi:hypothetical protein
MKPCSLSRYQSNNFLTTAKAKASRSVALQLLVDLPLAAGIVLTGYHDTLYLNSPHGTLLINSLNLASSKCMNNISLCTLHPICRPASPEVAQAPRGQDSTQPIIEPRIFSAPAGSPAALDPDACEPNLSAGCCCPPLLHFGGSLGYHAVSLRRPGRETRTRYFS